MRFWQELHWMISDYLNAIKNQKNTKPEDIIKNSIMVMENNFLKSKNRDYNDYKNSGQFWLSEHFYNQDCDVKFEKWKNSIINQFDNFIKSDLLLDIQKVFSKWVKLFIEDREPNFEKMQMKIDNDPELHWIIIWAQPDFWYIDSSLPNKKVYIYDRKSGKIPEKSDANISDQLKVYAYKTLQKLWMGNFENYEFYCYEVFLKNTKIFWWKIKRQDIYDIQQKIALDVVNQKSLLVDRDHKRNIPLPVEYFNKTSNTKKCDTCRFRKVCNELENYKTKFLIR